MHAFEFKYIKRNGIMRFKMNEYVFNFIRIVK